MMQKPELGVVFPSKSIGSERGNVANFAPTVECMGFDFIVTYDHVLSVNGQHPEYDTKNTNCIFETMNQVHEPMVLLGAMALQTSEIKLVTGCLVAPMRQTALIAKQAAEIDNLSDGRLMLGVSLGWNRPEFNAMGADFAGKPERIEKQINVLRKLWSGEVFESEIGTESFSFVDVVPLPRQQPIPILMGGLSVAAIKRSARLADGWIPLGYINETMQQKTAIYREELEKNGKSGQSTIMGRVNPWNNDVGGCAKEAVQWAEAGATHIAIGSSDEGYHPSHAAGYYSRLQLTKRAIEAALS